MPLTQVDVCNLALDLVSASGGGQTIEPLDPDGVLADVTQEGPTVELVKRHFEPALRHALQVHPWKFAKDGAALISGTAPGFGWTMSFALPEDYVRLVKLNGNLARNQESEWFEIQGSSLLTDERTADVEYIKYVDDPALWTGLFTTLYTQLLASRIAPGLRQDGLTASAQLLQLYIQSLGVAKMEDSNERQQPRQDIGRRSSWVQSRYFRTI